MVRNFNGSTSVGGTVQIPGTLTSTNLSQNLYIIHPSENTSNSIANPPLDGKNYHSWLG